MLDEIICADQAEGSGHTWIATWERHQDNLPIDPAVGLLQHGAACLFLCSRLLEERAGSQVPKWCARADTPHRKPQRKQ